MQRKTERKNKMKEFDEMNENLEVSENTERKNKTCLTKIDMVAIAKIVVLVLFIFGCIFGMENVCKNLDKSLSYESKARVSAGIITDKEIINGHTAGGAGVVYYDGKVGYNFNNGKSYVPTVYRIHISAEFEYDGETHQGSNYFDVSEDVYNSYNVGDYFDSKDLTGSSE